MTICFQNGTNGGKHKYKQDFFVYGVQRARFLYGYRFFDMLMYTRRRQLAFHVEVRQNGFALLPV